MLVELLDLVTRIKYVASVKAFVFVRKRSDTGKVLPIHRVIGFHLQRNELIVMEKHKIYFFGFASRFAPIERIGMNAGPLDFWHDLVHCK